MRREHDPERQRPGVGRPRMSRTRLGSGAVDSPCSKHHGPGSRWSRGSRVAATCECDHRLRRPAGGLVAGQHGPVSRLPSRNARTNLTRRCRAIMGAAPRRLS
jgi:hypothetical protein